MYFVEYFERFLFVFAMKISGNFKFYSNCLWTCFLSCRLRDPLLKQFLVHMDPFVGSILILNQWLMYRIINFERTKSNQLSGAGQFVTKIENGDDNF